MYPVVLVKFKVRFAIKLSNKDTWVWSEIMVSTHILNEQVSEKLKQNSYAS